MKRCFVYFCILLCLLAGGCNSRIELTAEQQIENKIKDYINRWDYKPGISVSVFSPTLSLNYNFSDGMFSLDNSQRNTKETKHLLFSITKSFTASAVIKLVNEGKLSYDDRVSDYFIGLNEIYINMDATISELLSHRSGMFDYTDNALLFYNNPFINGEEWLPMRILDYIEIPAASRDSDIGKYLFNYSSANYILLGLIVEKVTGKPLSEYIKENFLVPYSFDLLLTPQDAIDYSLIAHPHVYPHTAPLNLIGDGKTPIDATTVIDNIVELSAKCSWAAGGMTGTAAQIARWGYELLSERGGIDANIRNSILDSVAEFDASIREAEAYGYGIRKLFHNGYELIGSYGRSIGDENLMFYNKDKDLCICILTNSNTMVDGNPNIDDLMYAIFDII